MSHQLEARLREAGFPCRIEEHGRLAILVPHASLSLGGDARALILRCARDEGFTHAAVEFDPDGATLPRD